MFTKFTNTKKQEIISLLMTLIKILEINANTENYTNKNNSPQFVQREVSVEPINHIK